MKNYDVQVGKIIAKHRKDKGITQLELSKKLGWGRSTISNIERGDISMGLKSFQDYCTAIGADPDEIFKEIYNATRKR